MDIRRALVSVSDKTGIEDFCRELAALGVELLSTGGTCKLLAGAGIPVTEISAFTGFPEILDGRVKTLHPLVHGGILAVRDNPAHQEQMDANAIKPIDMVVVNLYPFEQTIAKPGASLEEAIENIDIGGPTMLRSAAKNHAWVTAVVDPEDYAPIVEQLQARGKVDAQTRARLALKVFSHTARYDSLISNYLGGLERPFPAQLNLTFREQQTLRYGENPHQQAFFYSEFDAAQHATVANLEQLQGKELSFNNIIDLSAALSLCREFANQTFCCILKHTNPCGAALGQDTLSAFTHAWATDPLSAFGSIIGFTSEVDKATAEAICRYFVEIVAAPGFSPEAQEVFAAKKNLRLMRITKPLLPYQPQLDYKRVSGGLLVQEEDWGEETVQDLKPVTDTKPAPEDLEGLLFAWKLCKHIKSNAICFASRNQLLGVGAGQMSRVDSVRIAADKAQTSLKGSYLASDAFFPFRDGVDAAAEQGVQAIIQPGGSRRDQEVIDACNEHGIAMVFSGRRHFRH